MDVPSEFICPITMEIMVNPVATRYGQNFDRTALLAWMDKGSGECPLTRKALKMTDLINNNFLAKKIRLWRETHDYHNPEGNDMVESPEEEGEDDEVLILMYGTTTNPFQLPTDPSSLQSATLFTDKTNRPPMGDVSPRLLIRKLPLRARFNHRFRETAFSRKHATRSTS